MVLVFDLDDTLFEELSFVRSGFRAVANYIEKLYGLDADALYKEFLSELSNGRGKIFDHVLYRYEIFSCRLRDKLITEYRLHNPHIKLYDDADHALERFSSFPVYIVTDGNKLVQASKIKTLGLHQRVKKVYIAHLYGLDKAKPSPWCFFQIAGKEMEKPENIVYIGDNPLKDFVGIKPFGFRTIRVLRGNYSGIRLDKQYEADEEINNLDELEDKL